VKFVFYPSKLKKQHFFANNFKIQGGASTPLPPSSDAHVHTFLKWMLTTSCATAFVERAVDQDGGVINILAKSLRRKTIKLQLL